MKKIKRKPVTALAPTPTTTLQQPSIPANSVPRTYDIGTIPSSINALIATQPAKSYKDVWEAVRKSKAPYCYLTPNCALYYGNKCIANVTKDQVIEVMNLLENYIQCIETDFGLRRMPELIKSQRFIVYMSHSGLAPGPQDPGDGIAALANEYTMILTPEIFMNIKNDKSYLIHELGHALYHVPGKSLWLEESLNEFTVHYYIPTYVCIYDGLNGFILRSPWVNIFSDTTRQSFNRYDFGAFWAFIAYTYGGPKTVGDIADYAFTKVSDPNSKVYPDYWEVIADYLKITSQELIMTWIESLMQLKWWRDNPAIFKLISSRYGKTTPFNPKTLVWNKATVASVQDLAKNNRIEKGGFEVLPYQPNIVQALLQQPELQNKKWTALYITHFTDASTPPLVSRNDTIPPTLIPKLRLVACTFTA